MLRIDVRDFIKIDRAQIEVDKITMLIGANEAGKSSVLTAVRCALSGNPLPSAELTKGTSARLVRAGAKTARVSVAGPGGTVTMTWPDCKHAIEGAEPPAASRLALGLDDLTAMKPKERARLLAGIIDSVPSASDLAAEMRELGYNDDAIGKMWERVTADGWDRAQESAIAFGAKLKAEWEAITGLNFGTKRAEAWRPEGLAEGDEHLAPEILREAVTKAQAEVERRIGQGAVSDSEIADLEAKIAAPLPEKPDEATLRNLDAKVEALLAERAKLPSATTATLPQLPCPHCGAVCEVDISNGKVALRQPGEPPPKPADAKKIIARIAEIDGEARRLRAESAEGWRNIQTAELAVAARDRAKRRLEELRLRPAVDAEALQRARDALAAAQAREAVTTKYREATHKAFLWARNQKLIDVLGADGLRFRKLGKALDPFNARLAELCGKAGWKAVRIDPEMAIWWGEHPWWLASASAQWRVRLVLQAAAATLEGAPLLVLDAADILDGKERNRPLISFLKALGLPVLVAMTTKPASAPMLAEYGMGRVYQLSDGEVVA